MGPVTNKRIVLKEYPTGNPVPGQTTMLDASQTIDLDIVPLKGGVLIKTLILSLDPYMHSRMQQYMPASSLPEHLRYTLGEPIDNTGVCIILRSENPAFQAGDHLYGSIPFQEYSVLHETETIKKLNNEHNLPWSVFVGIGGMAGRTAWYGWKEHSHAKKGEVVFVSSGAGAVGSLIIQLAKREGMKVIASAGSDDKVQFMKELGADVAFNYKTTKTSEILENEGPIDVYWDNVGGKTLDAALGAAARHARFIECGMIADYGGKVSPTPNLINVITKEISLRGFVFSSLASKYEETFDREVLALVASKDLTYREEVTRGLENAEVAFDSFLKGAFIGKGVVMVADE